MTAGVVSRRSILRTAVAISGSLVIGIDFYPVIGTAAENPEGDRGGTAINAFLKIGPDDSITFIMPAVEMGQGSYTSLSMLIAEELDVNIDRIGFDHAPPDETKYANPVLGIQATGGSTSTAAWFLPLRKAGAAARMMLLQAASMELNVPVGELQTKAGLVRHAPSGRTVSYGVLAGQAATLLPPENPLLKDPKDFVLIGHATSRIDAPKKVVGKTIYGIDMLLPGLRFATLSASPVFGGHVAEVDGTEAMKIPGVRQVVVLDDLVAVVGDHMWAAKQGLDALTISWDGGENATVDQEILWSRMAKASESPGVVAKRVGDAPGQLKEGDLFEATFELPFLAHAPMEPMNCTVEVTSRGCEIWVGTQAPVMAQRDVGNAIGLDPKQVIIHNHQIGGGFGRRLEVDGIVRAARIAQKVTGPIKVVWTREEDIQQEHYRPLYRDRMWARLEGEKVIAWHHRATGPSILARWFPPGFKDGIDPDAVDGAVKQPYDIPNVLVEYVRHEIPEVPVGFWRGVGPNSNIFAAECFLDLIAHQTSRDPVAFRRAMLGKSPRALRVLDLAAEKADWSSPLEQIEGMRRGKGIALLSGFGSFLAAIAEVAVADTGDVRVTRIVSAVDVGTVVNPDGLEAQIQGGFVFGMGTVLYDAITIESGHVVQSNFHDYRLPRINEIPPIEIHVLSSTESPGGIGEPGTVVIQPAIANAVLAATGTQLQRMPIDRRKLSKAAA